MDAAEQLIQALKLLEEDRKFNTLTDYRPYEYQKAFHGARGGDTYYTGKFGIDSTHAPAQIRAMIAGNQVGKTMSAAREAAFHATGLYPDWWKGHRFAKENRGLVCGVSADTTRNVCQNELFGEPGLIELMGTGAIPKNLIGKVSMKSGVINAYDSVAIKHVSGGLSKIHFGAYKQDIMSQMGSRMDWVWGDEEPPQAVHSQFMRSTLSTKGIIFYTFTPENGHTQLVYDFLENLQPHMAVIKATWDDAKHFDDPEYRHQAEMQFPEHEREMRRRGIPMMGAGMVWPVLQSEITHPRIEIPRYWPRIAAVDFGKSNHPFAAVWIALDRESDTIYLYDAYRAAKQTIPTYASALKSRGRWIPIVWPHDMNQADPQSSRSYAKLFMDEECNFRQEHFTNPPFPGMTKGDIGVESGVQAVLDRMRSGRFKVFEDLHDWFDEWQGYHREVEPPHSIVKIRDDLMSATRYACQSTRFAYTEPVTRRNFTPLKGVKNW